MNTLEFYTFAFRAANEKRDFINSKRSFSFNRKKKKKDRRSSINYRISNAIFDRLKRRSMSPFLGRGINEVCIERQKGEDTSEWR